MVSDASTICMRQTRGLSRLAVYLRADLWVEERRFIATLNRTGNLKEAGLEIPVTVCSDDNRYKMQYHTIWIRKDETDPVDENEENEEMLMGLDIMAPESQWGVNLQIRDCTGAEETVCEVEMTPEKAEEVIDTARKMAAAYEAQEREQERLCRLRMLKAQYLPADRTK